MNEDFMLLLREQPDERLLTSVRSRLRRVDAELAAGNSRRTWARAAMAAGVALSIGVLFALPPVRATARQFLDVFRVTSFVAVPMDSRNLERLANTFDLSRMIGEQVEIWPAGASRRTFDTVPAAAQAVGMSLNVPHYVPNGLTLTAVEMESESVMRIVASTAKLRSVMDLFEMHDLSIPDSLDGEVAIVTMPAVVTLTYESEFSRLQLSQAQPPQVSLPAGLDLPTLGEIALRVAGLPTDKAKELAYAIDWRSTFAVPMSPNVNSFQQVTVQGRPAIHVVLQERRERHLLLWSDGERVYVMRGTMPSEMIAVANSLGPA